MEQLLGDNWESVLAGAVALIVGWLVGRGYLKREQVIAFVGLLDQIFDGLRATPPADTKELATEAIKLAEKALARPLTDAERKHVRIAAGLQALRRPDGDDFPRLTLKR